VRKQVEDLGEQLPEEAKTEIEASVVSVEEALKADDTEQIKTASDALQAKFAELAAAAQQAAGGDPGAAAAGGAAPEEEDSDEPKAAKGNVVDAEFEEVSEDKS